MKFHISKYSMKKLRGWESNPRDSAYETELEPSPVHPAMCGPTGNRTPNSAVTGLHYSRLTMRPLLWRQWESNPPHFPCKGESPSLGTCVPIFFHQHVKEHSLNQHHKVTKLFPFRQALKQKNPPFWGGFH